MVELSINALVYTSSHPGFEPPRPARSVPVRDSPTPSNSFSLISLLSPPRVSLGLTASSAVSPLLQSPHGGKAPGSGRPSHSGRTIVWPELRPSAPCHSVSFHWVRRGDRY